MAIQPVSADMARKDSTISIGDKQVSNIESWAITHTPGSSTGSDTRFPASRAVGPSANGFGMMHVQADTMSSAGPWNAISPTVIRTSDMSNPFGSDRISKDAYMQPANAMHPDVAPFQPGAGLMKYLNVDSTPDKVMSANVKAATPPSSTQKPISPIGSGSPNESRLVASPVLRGPDFTTDMDMNYSGSRYVQISNMPSEWIVGDMWKRCLAESGLSEHVISSKMVVDRDNDKATMYVWFDDLRMAQASREVFGAAITTMTFGFITHHEYFAQDNTHPRARSMSAFDGQIEVTIKFLSPIDASEISSIFERVHSFTEEFGSVRAICLAPVSTAGPARFRVEYFNLASADAAIFAGEVIGESEFDKLKISVSEYLPKDYRRYAHPASTPPMQGSPVTEIEASLAKLNIGGSQTSHSSAIIEESPTGRTAWCNGQPVLPSQLDPTFDIVEDEHVFNTPSPPRGRRDYGAFDVGNDARTMIGPSFFGDGMDSPTQVVDIDRIIQGLDVRTTIMVRNVPNKVTSPDFKRFVDESSLGLYDFSYLRVDFATGDNIGYAFINFLRPEYIIDFYQHRVGKIWNYHGTRKATAISYATCQGYECLIAKFRNSSVLLEFNDYRPRIWYHVETTNIPDGKRAGDEAPFPSPNNMSKLQRSLDNARAIGLFAPRNGQHRDNRHRNSQFDRGTPRALVDERRNFSRRGGASFNSRGSNHRTNSNNFRGNGRRSDPSWTYHHSENNVVQVQGG